MLVFNNVHYAFADGEGVFGISFQVTAGEIVALVGLNGSGKTTLMRLALGMLQPQQGTIYHGGYTCAELPKNCWAQVGAFVDTSLAYSELTVKENLELACQLHHASRNHVGTALSDWQLHYNAQRKYKHLSLGFKQRVGLAASMQHNPKLIILDEPSNALDPAAVLVLRAQLLKRAEQGAGILVSSHHLDEVARTANRVLLINRGRLIGELDTVGVDLERVFFDRIYDDDQQRGLT